jgi:ankyrin repeat protein
MRLYPPRLSLRALGVLDSNAKLDAINIQGKTPLLQAVECGHLPLVQLLLARGACVNQGDRHAFTPLMVACAEGHTTIVRLLIARGAEVNAITKESRFTPLFCAVHSIRMVRRHEGYLRSKGSVRLVECLLRHGADIAARDRQGNSILQYAATHDRVDLAQVLLAHKADANAQSRQGYTPLIKAAVYGSEAMVHLLLKAGADRHLHTQSGHTALWFAQRRNRSRIAALLMPVGVEPQTQRDRAGFGIVPKFRPN